MKASAAIFALLVIVLASAANAQGDASIGLYTDQYRGTHTAIFSGAPTEFTAYVYMLPGAAGMIAAEFAVSYPPNVIPVAPSVNPAVSVAFGDLDAGATVSYTGCQSGWVWSHRQTIYLLDAVPAWIEPIPHGTTGLMQSATCAEGYPVEPMSVVSRIRLNEAEPPDTIPPALASVTQLAGNAVQALFSEPVRESEAETPANYELFQQADPLSGSTIIEARLDSPGTAVTLYTNADLVGPLTYVLRVNNVLDLVGNEIAANTELAFPSLDLVPPGIVSASALNDSVIAISFTEPLSESTAEDPDNYRLFYADGSPCAAAPDTAMLVGPDSVLLQFASSKIPTSIQLTLRVTGVTDLAGNVIPGIGNGFTIIVADTRPPYVQAVHAPTATTLSVIFNKPVNIATSGVAGNYEVYERDDTLSTVLVVGAEAPNGLQALLTLGAPLPYEVAYVLRTHGIEDTEGHAMTVPDTIAFFRRDLDAPIALVARAVTRSIVEVVFNEPVNPLTALSLEHYMVTLESTGYLVPLDSAEFGMGQDTVRLHLGEMLQYFWTYQLRLWHVTDLVGNMMSMTDLHFSKTDLEAPILQSVGSISYKTLDLLFDEPLNKSIAETAANYTLFETADPAHVVPISTATLVGGVDVRLALTVPPVVGRGYTIQISNIADQRGNVVAPGTSFDFIYTDSVAPRIVSAQQVGSASVRVSFSEPLDPATAENPANYEVFESLTPTNSIPVSSASLVADSSAVMLGLAGSFAPKTYTVRVNNVADRAGNVVSPNGSTTFTVADTAPPLLTGVTPIGAREIDAVFNERLLESTAERTSNYLLRESADTSRVDSITVATLLTGGTTVRISLAADLVAGRGYSLLANGIADVSGNVMQAARCDFVYRDTAPPQLVGAAATAPTAVRAVFSERLDPATAEQPVNYLLRERFHPSVVVPVASASLQADSVSVLLGLGGSLRQTTYDLVVTGIADRALNPIAPGSTIFFSVPDIFPPFISQAFPESMWNVAVLFNEPLSPASATTASRYRVARLTAPPETIAVASAALGEGGMRVALSLSSSLAANQLYRVLVTGVTDLASNPMPPGSGFDFTSYPAAPGPGIGLYVDEVHYRNTVLADDVLTPFTMYVWVRPGTQGLRIAQFAVPLPDHVLGATLVRNEDIIASEAGTLPDGIELSLLECQRGWTWLLRQECVFERDYAPITVSVLPDRPASRLLFHHCGSYPFEELPALISSIYCSKDVVATLLESSSVAWKNECVEVAWRVSVVDPGVRFTVSRAEGASDLWRPLGSPIAGEGLSFLYRDADVAPGMSYRYRVTYTAGAEAQVLFDSDPVTVPVKALALEQNSPNPFNPSTTIGYYVPAGSRIALEVFDISGRRIVCLAAGTKEAGRHTAAWNGTDESGRPVAAGIYVCRLTAGKTSVTRKMVLLR